MKTDIVELFLGFIARARMKTADQEPVVTGILYKRTVSGETWQKFADGTVVKHL